MAYERLHWVESETPLSADNMNNIEDGIEELQAQKVDKASGKGLYPDADKTKLAGIEAGAEVNQNAFSNVKVGSTTLSADSKTDTLNIGGSNHIVILPSAELDSLTIATDLENATASAAGLMGASDKSKLNGIEAGANNYALTTETLTANISGAASVSPLSGRTLSFSATGLTSSHVLCEINLDCSASGICIGGWYYVNGSISVRVFNASHANSITIGSGSYIRLRKYK